MDNLIWDSSTTEKTLEDHAKTNGILESAGVTIMKPKGEFYSRCKPGSKLEDFVIVEVAFYKDPKTQKETQYILRGIDSEIHRKLLNTFKPIRKPAILVPYQDSGGNENLWVCKMAGKGQNQTVAHTTAIRAIQAMCEGWRMVWFDNLATGYNIEKPDSQDAIENHPFKEFTQSQLINFAFGDNIIQDLDHDLVKIYQGKKL